jgi:hypothetical protein
MAKELPYFRFTPQEWQNGDISLETYEAKGLFIDVCSYYWIKDCSITITMLEKRFNNEKELLQTLFELNIIKVTEDNEFIEISFLNEQFDLLSEARQRRQEAGSKGGKARSSNAKAMLKQSSSYKDNNKDNNKDKDKEESKENNIITKEKSKKFTAPTYLEVEQYGKERNRIDLCKTFYDYYAAGNWKDAKGNQVKNWKQKFVTWEGRNVVEAKQPEIYRRVQ